MKIRDRDHPKLHWIVAILRKVNSPSHFPGYKHAYFNYCLLIIKEPSIGSGRHLLKSKEAGFYYTIMLIYPLVSNSPDTVFSIAFLPKFCENSTSSIRSPVWHEKQYDMKKRI